MADERANTTADLLAPIIYETTKHEEGNRDSENANPNSAETQLWQGFTVTVPDLPGMTPKQRQALEQWTLHAPGPLTPEFTIVVEIYEKHWATKSQRFRWRAKRIGNNKNMANGGEGYSTEAGLIHALKVLWPNESGSHVVVKYPEGGILPLTEVKE